MENWQEAIAATVAILGVMLPVLLWLHGQTQASIKATNARIERLQESMDRRLQSLDRRLLSIEEHLRKDRPITTPEQA